MRAEAIAGRLGMQGSLRRSLLLLCVLFLTLYTAMLVYWGLQTRQLYLQQGMATVDGLAGAYTAYTENAIHEIDFSLRMAQEQVRQRGGLGPELQQSLRPALELRRRHTPYISNLALVDARGSVVGATRGAQAAVGQDVTDRGFFTVHRGGEDAGLYVGPVFASRWVNQGERRFSLSRRLSGPGGEFLGVAVAIIDARALAQDFARQLDDPSISVTLLRVDGMVLARVPYQADQMGKVLPSFGRYQGDPPYRSNFVMASEIDQVTRLIGQRRFTGLPLLIAATQLQDVALKRWLATLPLALGIWALAVLSTLGLAFLVLRQQRWRERAQAELRRGLEVFNEVQRAAQAGCIDRDLLSGEERWSDEMFRLLEIGRDRPGLTADMRHERLHPEDRERVAHARDQSRALSLPYQISYRLQMTDGRVKWISEACALQHDGGQRPVRELITLQDVTVARQAAQELAELRAELDARAGRGGRDPFRS